MEREQLVSTVLAAQNGNSNALNDLFNAYYNDVYYFALKTVKDQDLAYEITQEAFVEIINTLGNLNEPAAFVTWMKQITYHQCTRYFKKKKDILVDEDEDGNSVFDTLEEDRTEFIPDAALDQEDFRRTILAMLDQLSEEQRSAIMMYYFDELSVKEIAQIQGVSEGTVKSRLNYARKAIKASVESYEKKTGIKLHSFGFAPLLLWLFRGSFTKAVPPAAAQSMAASVSAATGATLSVTAVTATTTTAAAAATSSIATKIAAGVVAASLVVGGGFAISKIADRPDTEDTIAQEKIQNNYDKEWAAWNVVFYLPDAIQTDTGSESIDSDSMQDLLTGMLQGNGSIDQEKMDELMDHLQWQQEQMGQMGQKLQDIPMGMTTRYEDGTWQLYGMKSGSVTLTDVTKQALATSTSAKDKLIKKAMTHKTDPEQIAYNMVFNDDVNIFPVESIDKLPADHAYHFLSVYGKHYAGQLGDRDFDGITLAEFNEIADYVLGKTYKASEFTGLYATYHAEGKYLEKADSDNSSLSLYIPTLYTVEFEAFRTGSDTKPEGIEGTDYIYLEDEDKYLLYDYTSVVIAKLVDGKMQFYAFQKPE